VFDLVPVVGPLLAAVPALIVAAFQGFGQVLAVVVVMLVAQQIESGVLEPLLAGADGPAVARRDGAGGRPPDRRPRASPACCVAVPLAAVARTALAVFYRERWEGRSPGG